MEYHGRHLPHSKAQVWFRHASLKTDVNHHGPGVLSSPGILRCVLTHGGALARSELSKALRPPVAVWKPTRKLRLCPKALKRRTFLSTLYFISPERHYADRPLPARNILLDQTRRSESDTVLSAFAQLVTLRLNAKWALISLIDGTNQYILVEATQSSRLQSDWLYNDGDQGLIFGCKTLARSLGICGNALDILSLSEESRGRPAPSPLIINDVMVDERFRNRPFVASHPSVRFFAAVPIKIRSGFYIGTISVMDNRPRKGLSNDEIEFLGDVGPTIIAHLEMNRVSEAQRRSEKMIKGLGVFMEGGTDLYDWWLELGNNQPRQGAPDGSNPEVKKEGELDGHARPASQRHSTDASLSLPERFNSLGITPERFNGNVAVADRPLVATPMESTVVVADATSGSGNATARPSPNSVLGEPPFEAPTERPAEPHPEANSGSPPTSRGQSSRMFSPEVDEGLIPERLKELFSRAGHIIQQSIEVDGTLFLDARLSTRRERSGKLHKVPQSPHVVNFKRRL